MPDNILTGVFGKLPAHGDFIHRNLPSDFISVWDEWLQRFIGGSQEQMGEAWLNTYLTSPIWRFSFSEGVIDANAWLGMIVPSVDRVGRYFPISVATKVPMNVNPVEFLFAQNAWFDEVEDLALQGLDGQLDVDELMHAIEQVELNSIMQYSRANRLAGQSAAVVNMEFEEQSPLSVLPQVLDAFLSDSLASYSTWTTRGSEQVEPCLFVTQGLPAIKGIAAMLDGQWSQWNWQQPYILNTL